MTTRLPRPPVKHGAGSVLVWNCISASDVGSLELINGIMDKIQHLNYLKNNSKQSAGKLDLRSSFIFQHDNDLIYTAKIVKLWQLHTLPSSHNLNVFENL
ncbi:transposable element Tc1 transposase [Nephila pilipes]|uniref:Transposable element Tc1 transposase n=1 Tax=Nephila pilipes TaxID=299642 RepID=A0A8X6JQY9_NEPPI|nr:transposable element Tc1 transposase [Nephila pilipes]